MSVLALVVDDATRSAACAIVSQNPKAPPKRRGERRKRRKRRRGRGSTRNPWPAGRTKSAPYGSNGPPRRRSLAIVSGANSTSFAPKPRPARPRRSCSSCKRPRSPTPPSEMDEADTRVLIDSSALGIASGARPARRDQGVFISTHEDTLVSVEDVFEGAASPEDYISAFERFVRENMNASPAMIAATQRPRELTRRELKALALDAETKAMVASNLPRAERATGRRSSDSIRARVCAARRVRGGRSRIRASSRRRPEGCQF